MSDLIVLGVILLALNRLDKIENILNQKIEGLSFCMELQFAFKVKTYCDMFLL